MINTYTFTCIMMSQMQIKLLDWLHIKNHGPKTTMAKMDFRRKVLWPRCLSLLGFSVQSCGDQIKKKLRTGHWTPKGISQDVYNNHGHAPWKAKSGNSYRHWISSGVTGTVEFLCIFKYKTDYLYLLQKWPF